MKNKIKKSTTVRLLKLVNQTRERLQKIFTTLQTLDFVILTEDEYHAEENADLIYELPKSFKVDKYSVYAEYVVMEIHKGKIKLGGLYDDYDTFAEGNLTELSVDAILALAELIDDWDY